MEKTGKQTIFARKKTAGGGRGFCLLRGMAAAFAVTAVIFIGFGILLTYTAVTEESLPLVSLLCTALSAAWAGYEWAVCMRRRGVLWGAAAGLVYTALLFLVTSLAAGQAQFAVSLLMALAVAVAGGACGGILGVNRKK